MRPTLRRTDKLAAIPAFQGTGESLGRANQIIGGPGQGSSQSLAELLERVHEPVRERLDRVSASLLSLREGQSPYLTDMLDHVLTTTGKQIRPALTLLASNFHPNDGRKPETIGAAVELLHIASLIHDDTVDDSDTRRGRATVSSLWGRNSAVLLGDYLFAAASTFVCDTGSIRVIRRFSDTIMQLATGELNELGVAYDTRLTRDDYLHRIYNKTASLVATAAEAGVVLSGAPEPVVRGLKSYGHNLGMAFQIVDDILDFDATREEVGKPVGKDLAQGIMTLPSIIAIERYPDDNTIPAFFERPGDAALLRRAVGLVQDPAIIEESYEEAATYCRRALDSVAELERNPSLGALEDLVYYVMGRRS